MNSSISLELAAGPFTIDRLDPAAADSAAPLFAAYPYKAAQRAVQDLDRDRLNALYLAGLKQSLAAGHPAWIASAGDQPIALAGLAPDPWHTQIYDMKMGKIQPWLNIADPSAGQPLLSELLAEASAQGCEYLSVRIDGEDYPNLHLFTRAGFLLVDVSMKFSRPMPFAPNLVAPPGKGQWTIRLSTPDDSAWMRNLGSRSHTHTHFLNDPNLPREKTEALFDAWVARCIEKLAYKIYVLEDAEGQGRGFVIYLRNRGFKDAVGVSPIILDYVILDPEIRGGGVGPWFVQETLKSESDAGFDFCELRTSQDNHAAVIGYEKLGFRLCSTDFVLHAPVRTLAP